MKKCPKCGAENNVTNDFCGSCGTQLENIGNTCPQCGIENDLYSSFCSNCGADLNNQIPQYNIIKDETPQISRTVELVLGILGGVFGLLGAVFALFLGSLGSAFGVSGTEIFLLGISGLLASVIGIISAVYVKSDAKYGGIALIICAVWVLISISLYGLMGCIFLGIAGVLALVRK